MLLKLRDSAKRVIKQGVSMLLMLSLVFTMAIGFGVSAKAAEAEPAGNWTDYAVEVKPEGNVYTIHTAEELAWIAVQTNKGTDFSGCTFILASDIDLSAHNWVPIGASDTYSFKGTFNGENHTISNMKINEFYMYSGLFGYTRNSTISNLILDSFIIEFTNTSVLGTAYIGSLAGWNWGAITNCRTKGTININSTIKSRINIGGFVGYHFVQGNISDSYSSGTVNASGLASKFVGGFIGINAGDSVGYIIANCHTDASVSVSGGAGSYAGGFVSENYNSIINCFSSGSVIASNSEYSYAGGFVRNNVQGNKVGSIANCYATGAVSATESKYSEAGGFACYNTSEASIKNCYARGAVIANSSNGSWAGGFSMKNYHGTILNCYIANTIECKSDNGVAEKYGLVCQNDYSNISNCYWMKDNGLTHSGVAASNCVGLTSEQLQNNGTIGTGNYSNSTIVDALNTVAVTIPDAKKWKVVSGINDGYPIFEGTIIDDTPSTNMPKVSQLYLGENHTLALCEDGTLWAWGNNAEGQLGVGSNGDKSKPTQITGIGKVKSVEAGHNHTFIICEDGSIWTWGKNDHGQLGIGNTENQFKPVKLQ